MIETGTWNELVAVRFAHQGAYLAEAGAGEKREEVLLPASQVPEDLRAGDAIRVFVYFDSEDRIIATVHEPKLTLGGLARLRVNEVNPRAGAFLDWGLEKDLLLPFAEQTREVRAGDSVLCALYRDKSGRLAATMNVYPYLRTDAPYRQGAEVSATLYETSENFGLFFAVDGRYSGRVPQPEANDLLAEGISVGDTRTLRISKILPDGKLDLTARKEAWKEMEPDAARIEAVIRDRYRGVLPFDDKADPSQIREVFGLSKAAFKRAVGHLYKERRVMIENGSIALCGAEGEE